MPNTPTMLHVVYVNTIVLYIYSIKKLSITRVIGSGTVRSPIIENVFYKNRHRTY